MKELTIDTIAKAVNGVIAAGDGSAAVSRVSKDSRQAAPGDLFFPLKGERFDGHSFIPQALEAGCGSFIVASDEYAFKLIGGELTKNIHATAAVNVILVKDANKALRDLAAYYIRQFDIKRIAVTGSNGKTTTKDMVYQICSGRYNTIKTEANMNNEVGLPLSVLNIEDSAETGIFEMGMYTFGEINMLADIIRPQIGIITNIGTAHIQNFESREGIRQAKMEITDFMDSSGSLVINADCDLLTPEDCSGPYKLISVGQAPYNNYTISEIINKGEDGVDFVLSGYGEKVKFTLPVLGVHNVTNAALAAAAMTEIDIGLAESAARLKAFKLPNKIIEHNGLKIIDDTYNASPDSMKAALDMLKTVKGKRHIAVLGDMNELGEKSADYHRLVGVYAACKGLDALITVGAKAHDIGCGAEADSGIKASYNCEDAGAKAYDIGSGAETDSGIKASYNCEDAGAKAYDIGSGAEADSGIKALSKYKDAGETFGSSLYTADSGIKVLFKCETKENAWEKLVNFIESGDVILVKGSRGMAMETLVRRIIA